jgi:SAM-dependent methyltransferase
MGMSPRTRRAAMVDWLDETSPSAAAAVVPLLIELVHPFSVLDVGCGVGAWLAAFEDLGVHEVLGVDGADIADSRLMIPRPRYKVVDLATGRLELASTFDLALCLEVGEHLAASAADSLVASLVSAAPVVAFSAAVPGQGGIGHINEQWPDYWQSRFAAYGYRQYDVIRKQIWFDESVAYWYRQNAFLYATDEAAKKHGLATMIATAFPERVVHPALFERLVRLSQPANHGVWSLIRALPRASRGAIRRRIGAKADHIAG